MGNTFFLAAFLEQLEQRREIVPHHYDRSQDRELDPHQIDAMSAITEKVRKSVDGISGAQISVQQSGGSGKTTLITNLAGAALDVRAHHADRDGKTVIVTTERALMQGMRQELCDLGIDKHMIGQWGAGRKNIDRPIVLTSIQALQIDKDLQSKLPSEHNRLVIGDEADTYLTEGRMNVINNLGGIVRVGLTATPKWPDGRHIEKLWGPLVTEFSLTEGIRQGVNVPPIFHLYEARIDESSLGIIDGDYDAKEIAQAYSSIEIERSIAALYGKVVPEADRKAFPALIYVPNAALVRTVGDELLKEYPDLSIRQWTGEQTTTVDLERDAQSYDAGEVDVLILCQMGGRGLNLKPARVLIDADPTLSPTKLEQRDSRVLRRLRGREEEKPFSVIVQIVPKSTKSRSLCLPDLLEGGWEQVERGAPLCLPSSGQGRAVIEKAMQYSERLKREDPAVHLTHIETVDLFAHYGIRKAPERKAFEVWTEELRQWKAHNRRWPSSRSTDETEKSLHSWLNRMRLRLRDDESFMQGEGKILVEMGVQPAIERRRSPKTFDMWVEELRSWRQENDNRWPSIHSKNELERSLASWLSEKRIKLREDKKFREGEGTMLTDMGIQPSKEKKRSTKTFDMWVEELRCWRGENDNRWPSGQSADASERSLYEWLEHKRMKLNDEAFASGHGKALMEMGVRQREKRKFTPKTFNAWIEELRSWRESHRDQWPSIHSQDPSERSLREWLARMRLRLREDHDFASGEGTVLMEMGIEAARKRDDTIEH